MRYPVRIGGQTIGVLERTEIERRSVLWRKAGAVTEVAADGKTAFVSLDDFLRSAARPPPPAPTQTATSPPLPAASPSVLFDVQIGNQTLHALNRHEIEQRTPGWRRLKFGVSVAPARTQQYVPLNDFLRSAPGPLPLPPQALLPGPPGPHPASSSTAFDVRIGGQMLRGLSLLNIDQRAAGWSRLKFDVSVAPAGTQRFEPLATFLQSNAGATQPQKRSTRSRTPWKFSRKQLAAAAAVVGLAVVGYFLWPESAELTYRRALELKRAGNYEQAARFFAKVDSPAADFNLALLYANGQGVAQDDARAVELLKRAADHGDPAAQTTLGNRYATGEGVPTDASAAAAWYDKAAHQGYGWAQMLLGLAYATGQGVTQDKVEADTWFVVAAAAGDANAAEERDHIELLLSDEQRRQATEQANTLAKQITAGRQS